MRISNANNEEAMDFLNNNWNDFFRARGIDWSKTCYVFKLEEEGKVLAMAKVTLKGGVSRLDDLFVLEECRNKNIGTGLLSHVELFASEKGSRCMFLETSEIHGNAKNFYLKRGYEIIASLPDYYYGLRWYLMKKEI